MSKDLKRVSYVCRAKLQKNGARKEGKTHKHFNITNTKQNKVKDWKSLYCQMEISCMQSRPSPLELNTPFYGRMRTNFDKRKQQSFILSIITTISSQFELFIWKLLLFTTRLTDGQAFFVLRYRALSNADGKSTFSKYCCCRQDLRDLKSIKGFGVSLSILTQDNNTTKRWVACTGWGGFWRSWPCGLDIMKEG